MNPPLPGSNLPYTPHSLVTLLIKYFEVVWQVGTDDEKKIKAESPKALFLVAGGFNWLRLSQQ